MRPAIRRLAPFLALAGLAAATVSGCDTAPAGTPFTITGSVQNLTPGAAGSLILTVHNPNRVPISVSALNVATSTAPAACPASNLTTTNFSGTLAVPANGTATKTLPISLAATAPDGCQNVSFGLTYTGAATYTEVFATHTAVASAPNPSTPGQAVTFTATVSVAPAVAPGPPTGSVTFTDGTKTLGSGTVGADGRATFTTSTLALGAHQVKAAYKGAPNFGTSTSPAITHRVSLPTRTNTLASSVNPSKNGQPVTFTDTLAISGPASTRSGTVTFSDGTRSLATRPVDSSGKATFSTSGLAVGAHSIKAAYSGDTTFPAGSSNAVSQQVNACPNGTFGSPGCTAAGS
jgi:hypothetical protein